MIFLLLVRLETNSPFLDPLKVPSHDFLERQLFGPRKRLEYAVWRVNTLDRGTFSPADLKMFRCQTIGSDTIADLVPARLGYNRRSTCTSIL